ncbi:ABC transporter substrate-binding protein [Nesterenkonia muleiensis]|uniref:ABC transporter substrate-binding protein n=1 Tax=Nesterenkonia muleiensis TaxID=2282648 RepID=UPI001300BCF2|nr:ABC transporter substrate-binding protein [Nesterenkonia muleiensis]
MRVGSGSVSTFDYAESNAGYRSGIGGLILEPLLVLDEGGQLSPWLAESWEEVDETTYVYNLREDATFSTGNPLTAEDVVFTYEYYLAEGSANAYNFPDSVEEFEATDNQTVTVHLSEPDAGWQFVPAGNTVGIFERAFYEENEESFGQPGTGVVGTGPWQLDNFNPTTGAELSANTEYWGGTPPVNEIEWTFYDNENSSAIAFRAGEIELVFPEDVTEFTSTAGEEPIVAEGINRVGAVALNVLQEPWDDVHVRRATAYALDKESLITASGKAASPQDTFIPENLLLGLGDEDEVAEAIENVPTYDYDPDQAREELSRSQYGDEVEGTLIATEEHADITQVIAAQLEEVGINVEVDVLTSEASTALVLGEDREEVPSAFNVFGGIGVDPGRALDFALGSDNASEGNWNRSNWSKENVDSLIAGGFSTSDPEERLEIYGNLMEELGENVPYIPIYLEDSAVALSDRIDWPEFSGAWRMTGPWALYLDPASE